MPVRYRGTKAQAEAAELVLWRWGAHYALLAGLASLHPDTPELAEWEAHVAAGDMAAEPPASRPYLADRIASLDRLDLPPITSWSKVVYRPSVSDNEAANPAGNWELPNLERFMARVFDAGSPRYPQGRDTPVLNVVTPRAMAATIRTKVLLAGVAEIAL